MNEILDFLRDLAANNDREWFAANKERYLAVKAKVELLAQQLIAAVAEVDPSAARLSVADCTYRIYRDTRFSHDKTPYKTHIGIFVNPPQGKKSMRCGYYLHLQPEACLFAAGTIGMPSPLVKAIRQSIVDEIDEYRSIIESQEFKSAFTTIGENLLRTAPKGFPKDWEYIDYLKPRDFCCSTPLSDKFVEAPDLIGRLRPYIAQAKRFNDFINYTVDEYTEK